MNFEYILLTILILFLTIIGYFIYKTRPFQDLIEKPKNYSFGDEKIYEIDINLSLVKKIEIIA